MSRFFLFITLLAFACSNKQSPLEKEFEIALNRYFKEVHESNISELDQIVLIPLSGCNPCIVDVMDHLIQNPVDSYILLTGSTNDERIKSLLQSLKSNYRILNDEQNLFARYRTSIIGSNYLKFGRNGLENIEGLKSTNLEVILK